MSKAVHLWKPLMWLKEKQAKQNPAEEKGYRTDVTAVCAFISLGYHLESELDHEVEN